jgi:hypothetical protein
MQRHPAVLPAVPLIVAAAACCPTTSGPTGPAAAFGGTLDGAALTFHDYPPPAGTTQMDVIVTWAEAEADVRLFWMDPGCHPIEQEGCQRYTQAIGRTSQTPPTIDVIATNQGPAAHPRMRFVLENRSPGRSASYTLTVRPWQAGCT